MAGLDLPGRRLRAALAGGLMPEGPEIRRAADALADAVQGEIVSSAWFAFEALKPYQKQLRGCRITTIEPRGKAMLMHFDNDLTLYSHNQLYGVWRVANAGERPTTKRDLRVALDTAKASILLYSASDISICKTDELNAHPFLRRIGPDVLDPALDKRTIKARLEHKAFARRQLGTVLLDQAFLAGLGNYLRVEILWQARLAPNLRPCDLDEAQREALADALADIPQRSYKTRGKRGAGHLQDTPFRFRAYHRAGKSCPRCKTPIERSSVASRPFYHCPQCQA